MRKNFSFYGKQAIIKPKSLTDKTAAEITGAELFRTVTVKFIEGLSNDQVGEITGRSPEAVRALQFRALAALRVLLSDEEQTDEREDCRGP